MTERPKNSKITVRLSDAHMQRLSEYNKETGADANGVIAALARSYIQTMIDTGELIAPIFPIPYYTSIKTKDLPRNSHLRLIQGGAQKELLKISGTVPG